MTLRSKPLGIDLGENPSGRGAYVTQVVEGGVAATRKTIEEGDFLVALSYSGGATDCAWLPLPDVLAAISDAPSPITLQMRRGGPEPWELSRDGSGLSVDDMMRAAGTQYGRLMDEEQEDALRSAFAALKDEERRAAADSAATGGFESDSLQSLSKLGFELRSFVQGARDALQRVQTAVVNRALLDARLAVQTAEYVLRRAAFDTGLVLEAGWVRLGIRVRVRVRVRDRVRVLVLTRASCSRQGARFCSWARRPARAARAAGRRSGGRPSRSSSTRSRASASCRPRRQAAAWPRSPRRARRRRRA